jgi:hypothetical protein
VTIDDPPNSLLHKAGLLNSGEVTALLSAFQDGGSLWPGVLAASELLECGEAGMGYIGRGKLPYFSGQTKTQSDTLAAGLKDS